MESLAKRDYTFVGKVQMVLEGNVARSLARQLANPMDRLRKEPDRWATVGTTNGGLKKEARG